MKIEVRWAYLLPCVSLIILMLIRHWPWLVLAYCLALFVLCAVYIAWRKNKSAEAAQSFRHALMLHLAQNDEKALNTLLQEKWRLSLLGLDGLVYEGHAFHFAMQGQYNLARQWARRAFLKAAPSERSRLLFNMARWTALSGQPGEAEQLLRQLLTASPQFMGARTHLGILLLRSEHTRTEALTLFAQAQDEGLLGRDPALLVQVAEAQALGADLRWQDTLEQCHDLGVSEEILNGIRSRAVR